MGLSMYAFSVPPSDVLPDAAAIARYRFPADGVGLPEGGVVVRSAIPEYLDMEVLSRMVDELSRSSDESFLASKYVLPGSEFLHRWRKHPDLHAWVQRLWRVRRHPNPNVGFNFSTPIGLESRDLDTLEHAVRHRQLPKGSGFFFGESDGSEQAGDLAFIAEARAAIAAGRLIYYTSWW